MLTNEVPLDILNMLQANSIILAAVGATVNERYKRVINFTMPISIQPYNFIVAKPKELSRLFLFTAPFTYDVCKL